MNFIHRSIISDGYCASEFIPFAPRALYYNRYKITRKKVELLRSHWLKAQNTYAYVLKSSSL